MSVPKGIIRLTLLLMAVCLAAFTAASCGKTATDPWNNSSVIPEQYVAIKPDPSTKKFTFNEWTGKELENIDGSLEYQTKITSVNQLPYRTSEALLYQSVEDARIGAMNYDYARSDYYKLLTGEENIWKLAVYENIEAAKSAGVYGEFFKTDYDITHGQAASTSHIRRLSFLISTAMKRTLQSSPHTVKS